MGGKPEVRRGQQILREGLHLEARDSFGRDGPEVEREQLVEQEVEEAEMEVHLDEALSQLDDLITSSSSSSSHQPPSSLSDVEDVEGLRGSLRPSPSLENEENGHV